MSPIPTDLQNDLRTAMAVELTTMPVYLYAYWSVRPLVAGGSQAAVEAARVIMSVIDEEMLHMAQAFNILRAIGGAPAVTEPPYLPYFPGPLLRHVDQPAAPPLTAGLYPLSRQSVELFMQIELPGWGLPPAPGGGWYTLAQLYEDIERKLRAADPGLGYDGPQLAGWNNPGLGGLVEVRSLADACTGIELIVEQGEGTAQSDHDDGEHELAHYWKFAAIKEQIDGGTIDLGRDVFPLLPNPNALLYSPEQQQANQRFNSVYSDMLDALQATMLSPQPLIFGSYDDPNAPTTMMRQLGRLAALLRNTGPVPGTEYLPGPTFAYLPEDERRYG